jgi:hypothetical protein
MHDADHYRELAERARRLADAQTTPQSQELLRRSAQAFDDIAEDIELGAIEIRHPELLPQRRRR